MGDRTGAGGCGSRERAYIIRTDFALWTTKKPSLAASRVLAYSLSMDHFEHTGCEENDDGNADSNPDRRGQRRRR
jgi:hypothetical protein